MFSKLRRLAGANPGKTVAVVPHAEVAILADSDNASITYLIAPYLAEQGLVSVRMDAAQAPPQDIGAAGCRMVVVSRYLPAHWLRALTQFRAGGGRVVYFMDDDLMDASATVGLPIGYAKKIRIQATSQRAALETLCAEFWVSSPYLQEKYRTWQARLILPKPGIANLTLTSVTTVCYHGTASHQAELAWLVDIIGALQVRELATSFEVFGNESINRLFRGFPRVSVLHPMNWPNYLAYTASVRRDIALAPLLPNPFNAARGPTKFFDFARMGAVGIYSDVEPYRGFIRNGTDGILLPNEPELWVKTILELSKDAPRRKELATAARARALSMAWDISSTAPVAKNNIN